LEHPRDTSTLEYHLTPLTISTENKHSGSNPVGEQEETLAGPDEPSAHVGRAEHTNPLLTDDEEAELKRIKDLPKEVGVMLMTVGVLGFVLPGVVGTPAVIAGGLVLWPKAFGKAESWFERKFPKVHKQSLHQIHRYLNDLEARYPNSTGRK
jgi:hypothetical protein